MLRIFKRSAMLALCLILPATASLADGPNIGACNVKQVRLGGEGGGAFTAEAPKILQLRTGSYVDNLILNSTSHGGGGGGASGVLTLAPEEYINRMVVNSGDYVDRLEFNTNAGRSLSGGGNGGTTTTLENIRVLALGGRSGSYLDQIEITYCDNYLD